MTPLRHSRPVPNHRRRADRRAFLLASAALAAGTAATSGGAAPPAPARRLPVAALVTAYLPNSHADVIVGKILEGWDQRGGPGPQLQLVSLYLDQRPPRDVGAALAAQHGVPLADSIDAALTGGGDRLQVAGVLSIAEHGDYPYTEDTRQHMYPRRRFFDEIVTAFRRTGQTVPVFNDKGLGYRFADAQHMVQTAQQMKFALSAGSSVPVAWRLPATTVPAGAPLRQALAIGYGGLESYGFHALELLQSVVERRAGGETGVRSVQVVRGEQIWEAERQGLWSRPLLDAALATLPRDAVKPGRLRDNLNHSAALMLIHYRDGLRAAVAMTNGHAHQFAFAVQAEGHAKPIAAHHALQEKPPFAHHGLLLRATEAMIHSGKSAIPVERTLLTTGILDAAMHSDADSGGAAQGDAGRGHLRLTPELQVAYPAGTWPFAQGPLPEPGSPY